MAFNGAGFLFWGRHGSMVRWGQRRIPAFADAAPV
jgi:hypothetical protein